jgi:ankyrin repeat protein
MYRARVVLLAVLFLTTPALATDLNDRLWGAASIGDLESVKAALEDGADVDYATPDRARMAVLHVAAAHGSADIVSLLLQRGANVNIVDKLFGSTPLITALSSIVSEAPDKIRVVEVLVANGADVRRADEDGKTPLHWAAIKGNREIVTSLLARGAEINALDAYLNAPLDLVPDAPTADYLLAHGARLAGISANGRTPLSDVDRDLFMAAVAGNADRVRQCVARGAHVNIRDSSQSSALIHAVYLGRLEAATALLEKGADLELPDDHGRTPLHVAAGQGFPKLVELLLTHRSRINARDRHGETPLGVALNAETATILLRAGADANVPERLCTAAAAGDGKLVELLLSYGAYANPKTKCIGGTPLLSAISRSKWDVVSILLDHGADPNAAVAADNHYIPLRLAAGLPGSADAVARLLARGANPNAADKDGDTALIEAARYGRIDVVKLLLDRGANVARKGRDGRTALAVAKDIETADLLISRGANVDDLIPSLFGKDAKLDDRQRALLKALAIGNVQSTAAAASSPAEIGKQYPDGSTPLQIAIMFGRANVIDWLLDHGADANTPNADGIAPLHVAIVAVTRDAQQKIHIMQSLVAHGAPIEPTNKDGMTPLHFAAASYNKDAADFLLRNGADPLRRTKDGLTPVQLAQRSGFGTGLLGMTTHADVNQKSATIEVLRRAVGLRLLPR